MRNFPFELTDDESLIIIQAKVGKYDLRLALDTGASHTIIDLNTLITLGYYPENSVGNTLFETGKGNVEAHIFTLPQLSTLGILRHNFNVSSYDFLGNGVMTDIEGVLGLDFFQDTKICLDFRKLMITIS